MTTRSIRWFTICPKAGMSLVNSACRLCQYHRYDDSGHDMCDYELNEEKEAKK